MDRAKAISPLSIRTKLCATNEDRAGAGCLRPNFAPCLEVPSDESPTAITNIGVAAHICAASSEGRRYLAPCHRRAPPLGSVEIFPISRRGLGHRKAARACKPRLKQNGRFCFTVGFLPNARGRVCRVNAVRFARYVLYSGAPGEIRTPDPQIRSLVLYPAELRARCTSCGKITGCRCRLRRAS